MGDQAPLPWKTTRDLMQEAARAVRHAPDRLLHGQRHRSALRQLARLHPRSVLIVCRGNLCRSPYAAGRLRATLQADGSEPVSIQSAGFLAPGRRPPPDVIAAAHRQGVDLARHRSCRLSPEVIRQADLVLAMEPEQQRVMTSVFHGAGATIMLLGDFDPQAVSTRAIPDPYGRPPDILRECFQRIDRCVQAVASCLLAAPPLVA